MCVHHLTFYNVQATKVAAARTQQRIEAMFIQQVAIVYVQFLNCARDAQFRN